jgi:RNA polymerase sigma-70 factor (ECF subfamily)
VERGPAPDPPRHGDELKQLERERLELVRRIASGENEALSELYAATSRVVFALALRILRDPSAAEDVTIEVFTQVWRQADRYDVRRGSPSAWLLTIARTRAIDKLRSTHQMRTRGESLGAVEQRAADVASPAETAADGERSEIVRAALEKLSPEQRAVIELAYFGGLSHSEIAKELDQPLGTVKTRTRLALMRLRESLRGLESEI